MNERKRISNRDSLSPGIAYKRTALFTGMSFIGVGIYFALAGFRRDSCAGNTG